MIKKFLQKRLSRINLRFPKTNFIEKPGLFSLGFYLFNKVSVDIIIDRFRRY